MIDNATVYIIWPDGRFKAMEGGYQNLRTIWDGGPFDFVRDNRERHILGAYIDDEGMLNGALFNVPASIVLARPIWGAVAICAADPDDEGNIVEAPHAMVQSARGAANVWRVVRQIAEQQGQTLDLVADPATIPPPVITTW